MTNPPPAQSLNRRSFLARTALISSAATLGAPRLNAASAGPLIKLGLIGCGGRGAWIAKLFADTGLFGVTACADYFPDRANAVGEAHGIQPGHRFTGLSGYRQLLETDVDAVAIETPPFFHPRQSSEAVAAGKHVFLAKPIAVDAPGCLTIAVAGQRATAANQVFLVDFQTRASAHYRQALDLVRDGAIGPLVLAEAHYPWRGGGRGRPPISAEDQLRSWYYVMPLSGDFIVEQSIHALDVATWILDADPVRAVGTGGRKVRPADSIYDHFAVTYWFPDDLVLSFTCIQSIPEVEDEIRARAFGADGVIDTDYYSGVTVRGKEFYRGAESNLYTTGAQTNIREFHECITQGRFDNPTVAPSVRSNLTAVLGREAAYRRGEVTWRELLTNSPKLEFDLTGLRG